MAGLLIPLSAMMIDVQRATVSAVFLNAALLLTLLLLYRPKRSVLPFVVIIACAGFAYPALQDITQSLAAKTAQVGLNMRVQEILAVIEAIQGHIHSTLFGLGWGSSFHSPAVGGLDVTFTHSLLTYMLLKTGFAGLGLTILYIGLALQKISRLFFHDPVRAAVLIWPVLIPVFLYASHKSLDFGLMLLLVLLWTDSKRLSASY